MHLRLHLGLHHRGFEDFWFHNIQVVADKQEGPDLRDGLEQRVEQGLADPQETLVYQ